MIPGSAENQCRHCVHLLSIISVSVLLYHMYPWYPISKFHSMNQIWTSTNVFYQVTCCFSHKQIWFSSSVTMIFCLECFSCFSLPVKHTYSLKEHDITLSHQKPSFTRQTFVTNVLCPSNKIKFYSSCPQGVCIAESAKFGAQSRDKLYLNRVVNHFKEALGFWQRKRSMQR